MVILIKSVKVILEKVKVVSISIYLSIYLCIYLSFQAPNKTQEDSIKKNNIYGNAFSIKISRKQLDFTRG